MFKTLLLPGHLPVLPAYHRSLVLLSALKRSYLGGGEPSASQRRSHLNSFRFCSCRKAAHHPPSWLSFPHHSLRVPCLSHLSTTSRPRSTRPKDPTDTSSTVYTVVPSISQSLPSTFSEHIRTPYNVPRPSCCGSLNYGYLSTRSP